MKKQTGKVTKEADGFKVRFERLLNHDINTVWKAITQPEKLAIWFTDIDMDFKPGGKMTIWFRDKDRTATHGEIVKIDPPHRFEFTWEGELGVWELYEAPGNKCRLVFTYSKLPDQYAVGAPAGFHTLLDRLEKMLEGSTERYPFGTEEYHPEQVELRTRYGKEIYKDYPELERYEPIIIEKTFLAPIDIVWKAISQKERMKEWYFDLPTFRAEEGFEFEFMAGSEEKKWLHRCRIKEVIPGRKISYTWQYPGYAGESLVSFELFPEKENTRLVLTHSGLGTFPQEVVELRKENFMEGWMEIIGTSLEEYLGKLTVNR